MDFKVVQLVDVNKAMHNQTYRDNNELDGEH